MTITRLLMLVIWGNLILGGLALQFADTTLAAATRASPGGKPFGLFNFPPDQAENWPFTLTRLAGDTKQLDLAAQKGLKVLVALTGAKRKYTDEKGCFSVSLWQRELDQTSVGALQARIDDGTVIGLYAIDEPHDWARSGSCKGVSFRDINAICAYARKKWPQLPCGVNAPPSWLRKGLKETTYDQIGFLFFQYNTRRGDVNKWLEAQLLDANWFKGKIFVSTNAVANSPSAAELEKAGVAMCKAQVDGVFMWRWPEAVEKPGIKEAMGEVAKACTQSGVRKGG